MGSVIKSTESDIYIFDAPVEEFEYVEFRHQPSPDQLEAKCKPEEQSELEKAKAEALDMLEDVKAKTQAIYKEAAALGYQAGIATAQNEFAEHKEILTAKADNLLHKLEQNIEQTQQDRENVLNAIEPAVVDLVLQCVEKVIRHEIKTDPRVVIRTITSCLRRIKDVNEVTVKVSPQEVAYVREQRDELAACSECVHSIAIVDDARVDPGGCVIESTSGDFDARINTQIEKIRAKIMETATNADTNPAES